MIRPNPTVCEIMLTIGILVEHRSGWIFRSTQGQRRLGEDWELMQRIFPNSLARICASLADSKASKSGPSTTIENILHIKIDPNSI